MHFEYLYNIIYNVIIIFNVFLLLINKKKRCYGTKNINISPILKIIPKIFGHSDKKVRDEVHIYYLM